MEERLAAAVARQERTAERAQRLESLVEGLLARIETLEGLPRPNEQGLLARLGALEGQVEGLSTRQDAPSTLAVQEYERRLSELEATSSLRGEQLVDMAARLRSLESSDSKAQREVRSADSSGLSRLTGEIATVRADLQDDRIMLRGYHSRLERVETSFADHDSRLEQLAEQVAELVPLVRELGSTGTDSRSERQCDQGTTHLPPETPMPGVRPSHEEAQGAGRSHRTDSSGQGESVQRGAEHRVPIPGGALGGGDPEPSGGGSADSVGAQPSAARSGETTSHLLMSGLPPPKDPSEWEEELTQGKTRINPDFPRLHGSKGSGPMWPYITWASMVQAHLLGSGLASVLTIAPPTSEQSPQARKHYERVQSQVYSALTAAVSGISVLEEKVAAAWSTTSPDGVPLGALQAWQEIRDFYIRPSSTNRQWLDSQLKELAPSEKESMEAFLTRAEKLRATYREYGQELASRELIARIFSSLSYDWRAETARRLGVPSVEAAQWGTVKTDLLEQDRDRRQSRLAPGQSTFLPLGFGAKGKAAPVISEPTAAPASSASPRLGSPRSRPGSPKKGAKKNPSDPERPRAQPVCWIPQCRKNHVWSQCPMLDEIRKAKKDPQWKPSAQDAQAVRFMQENRTLRAALKAAQALGASSATTAATGPVDPATEPQSMRLPSDRACSSPEAERPAPSTGGGRESRRTL